VARDVPLRRSLLLRLLVLSLLISIGSILATAWLAVRTTTGAIKQEQGRALGEDARIYDTLIGYAATHPDWSAAGGTVRALAGQTGRRITLLSEQRTPIAESAFGSPPPPSSAASAVIDPLAVDLTLDTQAVVDRIDPRAAGPFRLSAAERSRLDGAARATARCLRVALGLDAQITYWPSGRPEIRTSTGQSVDGSRCQQLRDVLAAPTPTEARALQQLTRMVDNCLRRRRLSPVELRLDPGWRSWTSAPAEAARAAPIPKNGPGEVVAGCIGSSRKEQLTPYVAPAALLYVSNAADTARSRTPFDLSPANRVRIAQVTALVLLAAVLITVFAGVQLIRPLYALIGAARRLRDGDDSARVQVSGRDEIARLASAFNDMSGRREELEGLRRAMVSDIAHEMRSPVTNIRGWLEAAQDGVAQPDPAFIASLLEEAMLLQHVIEDLQDLAAADAGELRLRTQPVRLGEVLGQVAAANRARAGAAGVALVTEVPEDVDLLADPIRLRQVIGNLVHNAIRHTPAGGSVTITARREVAPGGAGQVVIDVADTGSGIAAGDLPYVFDRFWRAEKSRSRQTGGSGLGLPIARKFAEAHGGRLTVASTPGRGSTFTVVLPLTDV
jgi:two-component system, OmpR family, sensor histidine kinase BaeS